MNKPQPAAKAVKSSRTTTPGRNELINKLSKKLDLTKVETRDFIKALFEEVTAGIKRGNPYEILGYGRFYISERKARTGRNPRTGQALSLPATKTVRFRVGRKLKAAVQIDVAAK